MKNGEYLNASSRFGRAIELDSSQGRYYFYRGLANFRSEDYRSTNDQSWTSAADFKRGIEEGFDSPRTRFMYANSLLNRGLFYADRDRTEESVKTLKRSVRQYRKVLAADWEASNAFHNMGVAYLEIGKLDLAKEAVKKAILTETSTPFFHDTLGEIYFQLGRFDKAIESWNLAQELDSSYERHPFEPLKFERSLESRIEEAQLRR
jgi:tetratricopeptide (TPR) repeat protein